MDAIEFLEEWPVDRRGLLHAAACETYCSAYDGRKSVEAAHKIFTTWARRVGVTEDVPVAAPDEQTKPTARRGLTNLDLKNVKSLTVRHP
ncbi:MULTISPECIES: DUF982 domain-containing protein [unclassified Mesorhizobium]|uniref:DUF982 domain-containing protein n=1 Tax=unclassified Mesorhizobium TaxID=325217 RepID=UPI001FE01B2A|nr:MULTISPECIES: DUF982 domain-containing protein [unclassified Mesorhizobium]